MDKSEHVNIRKELRGYSINNLDLQKDPFAFVDQFQIKYNSQNDDNRSDTNDRINTLTQSLCYLDPAYPLLTSSLSSRFYVKPRCLSKKSSFSTSSEKEIFHLLYDESYSNLFPLNIGDKNEICYATLPHGKVIDISSLYFKNNVSPSIFDMQETQSPREKRIARIVMAVAILLLTMCVVLVGVTLSMSGYIDSMVKELHAKRHSNANYLAFGNSLPKPNVSEKNQSLLSPSINTTENDAGKII